MEKGFLSKQYVQGAIINKQIEQLNKRDIFSRNATSYLPVVSKLQELYGKFQKHIEEVLTALEVAHEERLKKGSFGITSSTLQGDLEAATSLLQGAQQAIEEEKKKVEEMNTQKEQYVSDISIKRDTIREQTAKSGFSTEELTMLLQDITQLEKKIITIGKQIEISENLIKNNEQGKSDMDNDILGIEQQLEQHSNSKKEFDREYYAQRIITIFGAWYDSRPRNTIINYSTLAELFGVKPVENNTNLMKDGERLRNPLAEGSLQQVNTSYQKITYNKVLGIKNMLDALGVTLDENAIHQFNDVIYIYAKEIDKGIIVSNKKFITGEKEAFSHATFIIPGAPLSIDASGPIAFPTPLYARRIRFDNDVKREDDVLESLLKDNNDAQFRKVIHTYNEEKGTFSRTAIDKVQPIAESATEANVVKEIIRSNFKDKASITTQTYLDFAQQWNLNPENKYKIKSTLIGLRIVLGAKKPIDKIQYITAHIFDEQDVIEQLEKEYDENLTTVYNDNILRENIYSLVKNNILDKDSLGSIGYVKIFIERCAQYICEKRNIPYSTLTQKDKYKLIHDTYGISGVPSSLTVALGGLQSRDKAYQTLLLQKFIAAYENQHDDIIRGIQEKIDKIEPSIAEGLGGVEKNIFKAYKTLEAPLQKGDDDTDTEDQVPEEIDAVEVNNTDIAVSTTTMIIKAPVQKEKIVVSPEELEEIPESVKNTINRVVKIVHTASIDGQIDQITKLLLYGYVYCRKNAYLKKDTEKPHSYFSKFYQEKYIIEICDVATEIPDMFKLAFAFSCTERKMGAHIKKILEIQGITNKRR